MAQLQQDQFIDDDEEETCPLCIEELDLSDRNFRPCVCGYQVGSQIPIERRRKRQELTNGIIDLPVLLQQYQESGWRAVPSVSKGI